MRLLALDDGPHSDLGIRTAPRGIDVVAPEDRVARPVTRGACIRANRVVLALERAIPLVLTGLFDAVGRRLLAIAVTTADVAPRLVDA